MKNDERNVSTPTRPTPRQKRETTKVVKEPAMAPNAGVDALQSGHSHYSNALSAQPDGDQHLRPKHLSRPAQAGGRVEGQEERASFEKRPAIEETLDEMRSLINKLEGDLSRERQLRFDIYRHATLAFDRLAEVERAWMDASAVIISLRRDNAELTIESLAKKGELQQLLTEHDQLTKEIHRLYNRVTEAEERALSADRLRDEKAAMEARFTQIDRERAAQASQLEAAAIGLQKRAENAIATIVQQQLSPAPGAEEENLPTTTDLLPQMSLGQSARRHNGAIHISSGAKGHAIFGPSRPLQTGEYLLEFDLELQGRLLLTRKQVCTIEVVSGDDFIAQRDLSSTDLKSKSISLPFQISPSFSGRNIEFRLWTYGLTHMTIRRLSLEATS